MKSLRRILKRLRFVKSNCCKKLNGDWRNTSSNALAPLSPKFVSKYETVLICDLICFCVLQLTFYDQE